MKNVAIKDNIEFFVESFQLDTWIDKDDIVYVVINTYWEPQEIELPGLLDLFTWKMVVNTMEEDSIMKDKKLMTDRHCTIGPRSAMVFVAEKNKLKCIKQP